MITSDRNSRSKAKSILGLPNAQQSALRKAFTDICFNLLLYPYLFLRGGYKSSIVTVTGFLSDLGLRSQLHLTSVLLARFYLF